MVPGQGRACQWTMNCFTDVWTGSWACNGRFQTSLIPRPKCWLRGRDLLSKPHRAGYYSYALLLSILVQNPHLNLEWSDFSFFPEWELGAACYWLLCLSFICCPQECLCRADPVWYCVMHTFLVLTVTQTVMSNLFTTAFTTEVLLCLLFSFLLFLLFLSISTT